MGVNKIQTAYIKGNFGNFHIRRYINADTGWHCIFPTKRYDASQYLTDTNEFCEYRDAGHLVASAPIIIGHRASHNPMIK